MKLSKRRKRVQPDGTVYAETTPINLSLDGALVLFLRAQDAANHSKVTISDYKRVIGLFLRYMVEKHGYTSIDQIREADIVAWLAELRNGLNSKGRAYSSRSIETYCRDVMVFFRWLVLHGYLDVNPMEHVDTPKVEKALIRVFTVDELRRLDAACDRAPIGKALTPDERKALAARDRAFLWLLLSTGIRLSEACGLLMSDIDWDKGMIYVRGKGAKERRVPMGKVARQHLMTYIRYWRGDSDDDKHVFLGAFGRHMHPSTGWRIFERLKRVAGIHDKRVSPHICRHWFAVNCIKNGMPSTALQTLLGHETLEMINTYVLLAEQDIRELYDKFSPVDALNIDHSAQGRREQLREWRKLRKKKD